MRTLDDLWLGACNNDKLSTPKHTRYQIISHYTLSLNILESDKLQNMFCCEERLTEDADPGGSIDAPNLIGDKALVHARV